MIWDRSKGNDWIPPDGFDVRDVESDFVFARNVNIGIESAGSDDVVLLNDDALLKSSGGFAAMQRATQEHPEYGLVSATTNNVGNPNQNPLAGIVGLREEPRVCCFVCVFIPRRTINKIGLLDERFVGYGGDDDDYCLRVRRAGLKLGILDGVFVDHLSLPSTFRGDPRSPGDYSANHELFKAKWGLDIWGNQI